MQGWERVAMATEDHLKLKTIAGQMVTESPDLMSKSLVVRKQKNISSSQSVPPR